jgi:hypothetical protein
MQRNRSANASERIVNAAQPLRERNTTAAQAQYGHLAEASQKHCKRGEGQNETGLN